MRKKIILDRATVSVVLVTIYLLAYCALLQFERTQFFALLMLMFSPALIIWMVYTVLKHGKYNGPELGKEEFGYGDKEKDDLGIF